MSESKLIDDGGVKHEITVESLKSKMMNLEQKNFQLNEENIELRKLNSYYHERIDLLEQELSSLKSIFMIKLMNENTKILTILNIKVDEKIKIPNIENEIETHGKYPQKNGNFI